MSSNQSSDLTASLTLWGQQRSDTDVHADDRKMGWTGFILHFFFSIFNSWQRECEVTHIVCVWKHSPSGGEDAGRRDPRGCLTFSLPVLPKINNVDLTSHLTLMQVPPKHVCFETPTHLYTVAIRNNADVWWSTWINNGSSLLIWLAEIWHLVQYNTPAPFPES